MPVVGIGKRGFWMDACLSDIQPGESWATPGPDEYVARCGATGHEDQKGPAHKTGKRARPAEYMNWYSRKDTLLAIHRFRFSVRFIKLPV
jgi:hypothetical protein